MLYAPWAYETREVKEEIGERVSEREEHSFNTGPLGILRACEREIRSRVRLEILARYFCVTMFRQTGETHYLRDKI